MTSSETPVLEPTFHPAWRFTFLLPLRYNDDDHLSPAEPVEREKFLAVEHQLRDEFGGWSRQRAEGGPAVEGRFYEHGMEYADINKRYEIVVKPENKNRTFFLDLYIKLLTDFRQKAIFMTWEPTQLAGAHPALETDLDTSR